MTKLFEWSRFPHRSLLGAWVMCVCSWLTSQWQVECQKQSLTQRVVAPDTMTSSGKGGSSQMFDLLGESASLHSPSLPSNSSVEKALSVHLGATWTVGKLPHSSQLIWNLCEKTCLKKNESCIISDAKTKRKDFFCVFIFWKQLTVSCWQKLNWSMPSCTRLSLHFT